MINDDYQMFVTYAWIDQEYDHAQSLKGFQSTRDYRMGPIQANLFGVERNFTTTETADASLSNYKSKQFEVRGQSDLDSKTNGTGGLYYSTTDSLTNAARNFVLELTGTISGNQIVTIPNGVEKFYCFKIGNVTKYFCFH